MVTIDEIARRAGVSKSTVSNVLNNRDDRVSPETKSKVVQVIEELGYRSRRAKKGLVVPKTSTVAVLFPHSMERMLGFPLSKELMQGIAETAKRLNYQLIIISAGQDFNPTLLYEDIANAQLGDGFLVMELLKRDGRLKRFSRGVEPFVCLGKPEVQDNKGVSWVFIDLATMVEKAVTRLIEAGHRHIAFLGTEERRITALQAYRGFERALEKRRVPLKEDLRLNISPDSYQAKLAVGELLGGRKKVTAMFAESQVLAEGALHAAREVGRKVPQDLAVMSMLENQESAQTDPPLSGIDWKARELGRHALELLVRVMGGEEDDIAGRIVPTEVIVRQSCGTEGKR